MKTIELVLTRDLALGNGTRRSGRLGCFECPVEVEGPDLVQAAWDAKSAQTLRFPRGVSFKPELEDFAPREMLHALRSSSIELVAEIPKVEAENDWRDLPVEKLKLKKATVQALKKAGLNFAGELADYGNKNQGLKDLEGIGEAAEEDVLGALQAVAGE